MDEFVKIKIEDKIGKILKHHYIRINEWDLPGGKMEQGEIPLQAAIRELLERTGYGIDEKKLEQISKNKNTYLFKGYKQDLIKVAKPGEKGNYLTEIRWD